MPRLTTTPAGDDPQDVLVLDGGTRIGAATFYPTIMGDAKWFGRCDNGGGECWETTEERAAKAVDRMSRAFRNGLQRHLEAGRPVRASILARAGFPADVVAEARERERATA